MMESSMVGWFAGMEVEGGDSFCLSDTRFAYKVGTDPFPTAVIGLEF